MRETNERREVVAKINEAVYGSSVPIRKFRPRQRKTLKTIMLMLIAAVTLVSSTASAQTRHTDVWNFGTRCRLAFESDGSLTPTEDPVISTAEGSASFSHPTTGELLLYTDGTRVWQADGTPIVSDLPGNSSSLHSGIIVPRPLNPGRLYAFGHTFNVSTSVGYREFDVSDPTNVVALGANAFVPTPNGREGMVVVQHSNGVDYWVLVSGNNEIYVIPITSAGLGAPVTVATGVEFNVFGVFAASNAGDKLVISNRDGGSSVFSFDFDASTGLLANQTTLFPLIDNLKYGGAFSPDDSKLYYSSLGGGGEESRLYQYDFGTGINSLIDAQAIRYKHSQTKLGSDGKMYISTGSGGGVGDEGAFLSVITNPNAAFADLDFSFASVPMDPGCNPQLGLTQSLSPTINVAFGIDVVSPNGTLTTTSTTPAGTANLVDGVALTITVSDGAGFSETCAAIVSAGAWTCSTPITGLVSGTYTVTATDGNISGDLPFDVEICGDGLRTTVESCDDGNLVDGDGCSASCELECGFVCLTENAPCQPGGFGMQCTALTNTCSFIHFQNAGGGTPLLASVQEDGVAVHADGIGIAPDGVMYGFIADINTAIGSRLAILDPITGVATQVGSVELPFFVTGGAINQAGELWVNAASTYENGGGPPEQLQIAKINITDGTVDGAVIGLVDSGANPITFSGSKHPMDLMFRSDDAMVVAVAGTFYDVNTLTGEATTFATISGLGSAGIGFLPNGDVIISDINGSDELWTVPANELTGSKTFASIATLLYTDPLPENAGAADIAICTPSAVCGDSVVNSGETCDDGNATADDGCSDTCMIEPGYVCLTPGVLCTPGDSDDDGIPDLVECSDLSNPPASCEDTDNDLIPDYLDLDSDNDGVLDSIECTTNPCENTDTNGNPDYRDLDSDGDGLTDAFESYGRDTDGDGLLDGFDDTNGDGANNDTFAVDPTDTDNDNLDDYRSLDSDGDSIADAIEGHDADFDGAANTLPVGTDTDGDGIDDAFDPDCALAADCSGVIGVNSNGPDRDSDNIPDFQDLDSDNDGIYDSLECTQDPCEDTDNDGSPDYLDVDADGDGITDAQEAGYDDVDGDGQPDTFVDNDNDGVDDNAPLVPTDSNGDGTPDFQSLDSDGDTIPDVLEGHDANGDGTANVSPVGNDTDDDGLDDAFDPDCAAAADCNGTIGAPAVLPDFDVDGNSDFQDIDSDADGIPDGIECGAGATCVDTNLDGTPDYLDIDADGDSVEDSVEGHDVDADGVADVLPSGNDTDNDGLDDAFDADCAAPADCGGTIGVPATLPNRDSEGLPDFQDTDDDNDGIPTLTEVTDGAIHGDDPDNDGIPAYLDLNSDGDATNDLAEGMNDPATGLPWDLDNDGVPDYLDPDSSPVDTDGDGIPDTIECNGDVANCVDTDDDGNPDYQDIDDDNDGIPTIDELLQDSSADNDQDGDGISSHLDSDADGDGIPDINEGHAPGTVVLSGNDTDDDGLDDAFDTDNGGVAAATPDSDGVDGPDYLSLDSDGDGVLDIVEGHAPGTTEASGDDTDGDGIDDAFDADDGGVPAGTPDTDNDGTPDYQDLDDDGDAIPTATEDSDGDGDPTNDDADMDGIPNYLDLDSDGDGILDSVECATSTDCEDTDGDGTPDYLDSDSDNDGLSDLIEGHGPDATPTGTDTDGDGLDDAFDEDDGGTPASTPDTDGDGSPDYQDSDDDGDGIPTATEDVDGDSDPTNDDADGDGIPNYLDLDSDGDGITDNAECAVLVTCEDTDNDGLPDFIDADSDGDGIPDVVEGHDTGVIPSGTDSDNNGVDDTFDMTPASLPDTDSDGTSDYLDLDSDGDSVPDVIEGHDGSPTPSGDDTDGDGIDDTFDADDGGTPATTPDTDEDLTPDFRDGDDDNDGIDTKDEDGNGNGDLTDDDADGDGTPDYLDSDESSSSDILIVGGQTACASSPTNNGPSSLWLVALGLVFGIRRRKRT